MTYPNYLFCFIAMLFLFPGNLLAHGVEGTVGPARSFCADFHFDDGGPMSYAEVKIMLSGQKLPLQKGRTDANGKFCFYPPESGRYTIKANDGMGHALELSTEVDTGWHQSSVEKTALHQGGSKWQNALTGIGLIFGLFGLTGMLYKRKNTPVN